MIETLGECIEKNEISNNDVSIILFEKEKLNSQTEIKISSFDEELFMNFISHIMQ